MGVAPVGVGASIVFVDSDGGGVIDNGPLVIASIGVGVAPVVVGESKVFVDSDGGGVIGNGPLVIASIGVGVAPVGVGWSIPQVQLCSFGVTVNGLIIIAGIGVGVAPGQEDFGLLKVIFNIRIDVCGRYEIRGGVFHIPKVAAGLSAPEVGSDVSGVASDDLGTLSNDLTKALFDSARIPN